MAPGMVKKDPVPTITVDVQGQVDKDFYPLVQQQLEYDITRIPGNRSRIAITTVMKRPEVIALLERMGLTVPESEKK